MKTVKPYARYKFMAEEATKSLGRPLTTREKAFLNWVARNADVEGAIVLKRMFEEMGKK